MGAVSELELVLGGAQPGTGGLCRRLKSGVGACVSHVGQCVRVIDVVSTCECHMCRMCMFVRRSMSLLCRCVVSCLWSHAFAVFNMYA